MSNLDKFKEMSKGLDLTQAIAEADVILVEPVVQPDYTKAREQIQQAIGISASHSCSLGAVTAGKLTNMKNTVDPMSTRSGVEAALLAHARSRHRIWTGSLSAVWPRSRRMVCCSAAW